MKRKKSQLIGLVLIISAILLQVGYAAAATVTVKGVSSNENYAVQITSEAGESSDYVDVNVRTDDTDGGIIIVEAGNLYPGAYFTVNSTLENIGKRDVEFKSVNISCLDQENTGLYESLVFYNTEGEEISLEDYKTYLNAIHQKGVFKAGAKVPLILRIGLSPEVTELEDTQTTFEIEIVYGAKEGSSSDGGDRDDYNSDSPDTPPDIATFEEPIIPENLEIIDEEIPAGAVDNETDITDEEIPGGANMLPKTGGVSAMFVYALGLVMLGGGIGIYKKGKKEE